MFFFNDSLSKYLSHLARSVTLVICMLFIGCDETLSPSKSLPTPLAKSFPYKLKGSRRLRIWGGDNFEANEVDRLHYLVLQGVDSPKPGQAYFKRSKKQLLKMIRGKLLDVTVVGSDDLKREIAQVFVGDLNINLEMVKAGMAWWDGNQFEGFEAYVEAERLARQKGIGLWKDPNPIHPSEFGN